MKWQVLSIDDALNLLAVNSNQVQELKTSYLKGVTYVHFVNGELAPLTYVYKNNDVVDIYPVYTAFGWIGDILSGIGKIFTATISIVGSVISKIGSLMSSGTDDSYKNKEAEKMRQDTYRNTDAFGRNNTNVDAEGEPWQLVYGDVTVTPMVISKALITHNFLAPTSDEKNTISNIETGNRDSSTGAEGVNVSVLEVYDASRVAEEEKRRQIELMRGRIYELYKSWDRKIGDPDRYGHAGRCHEYFARIWAGVAEDDLLAPGVYEKYDKRFKDGFYWYDYDLRKDIERYEIYERFNDRD